MGRKKTSYSQKGGCSVGDIVIHNGLRVYVSQVLDHDPLFNKSFIKACLINEEGEPLKDTNIWAGYDWEEENEI